MNEHGRQWSEEQVAAGYHEQDWGPPPTEKSKVIGAYEGARGNIVVRLIEKGPSGVAELELAWENGPTMTVINESVAQQYLVLDGAIKML